MVVFHIPLFVDLDWFILLESSGMKEMEDLSFCESCVVAGLWKIWIRLQ